MEEWVPERRAATGLHAMAIGVLSTRLRSPPPIRCVALAAIHLCLPPRTIRLMEMLLTWELHNNHRTVKPPGILVMS